MGKSGKGSQLGPGLIHRVIERIVVLEQRPPDLDPRLGDAGRLGQVAEVARQSCFDPDGPIQLQPRNDQQGQDEKGQNQGDPALFF